jgi:hypothetical protein
MASIEKNQRALKIKKENIRMNANKYKFLSSNSNQTQNSS